MILAHNISEMLNRAKLKELWMQRMSARAISLWEAMLKRHHSKWHLIPQELGLNSKLKIWSRHLIPSKRQMSKSTTMVWLEAVTDSLLVIKVQTTFTMILASWPSEQHSSASNNLVIFQPHSSFLAKAPLSSHLLTWNRLTSLLEDSKEWTSLRIRALWWFINCLITWMKTERSSNRECRRLSSLSAIQTKTSRGWRAHSLFTQLESMHRLKLAERLHNLQIWNRATLCLAQCRVQTHLKPTKNSNR